MGAALCVMVCFAPVPASGTPWLFVSDIHYDPLSVEPAPVGADSDTNTALLDSAITEMQRVDADPPVVIIAGDFLAHYRFTPMRAAATMATLAARFNRAFPNAQFVIALGNEDSACGAYRLAPESPFLHDVAREWEPLVNRRHAAPAFAETFPRDGFYVAKLPIVRTSAVVLDDVFWSPLYRGRCAVPGAAPERTLAELHGALLGPPHERHWVIAHIPPGVDALSTTHIVHRLVPVPFLNPWRRNDFMHLITDPAARVTLVVAGHTHRFAYRIPDGRSGPIPMLLVPAVSPIYRNAPSFLTVDVDERGTIREAEEYALADDGWTDLGGTRSLGLADVSGVSLQHLQRRLAGDPALRATFDRLYTAGSGGDINERNWKVYWCAATAFETSSFRDCLAQGGFGPLLLRGVIVVAGIGVLVAVGVSLGLIVLFRRRRHAHVRLETR